MSCKKVNLYFFQLQQTVVSTNFNSPQPTKFIPLFIKFTIVERTNATNSSSPFPNSMIGTWIPHINRPLTRHQKAINFYDRVSHVAAFPTTNSASANGFSHFHDFFLTAPFLFHVSRIHSPGHSFLHPSPKSNETCHEFSSAGRKVVAFGAGNPYAPF